MKKQDYAVLVRYYSNQRKRRFREYMRSEYGARKYKIARNNTVHVHGVMPNTNTLGWYELGSYLDLALALVG